CRCALKAIGAQALLTLLLLKCFQNIALRLNPYCIKGRLVVSGAPISVSQADGIAERIDLPLPLMDTGLHIGMVASPFAHTRGIVVERIGIRINIDTFTLFID